MGPTTSATEVGRVLGKTILRGRLGSICFSICCKDRLKQLISFVIFRLILSQIVKKNVSFYEWICSG